MAFDPLPQTRPAGGYTRVTSREGVAQLFQSPAEYGPSATAFNDWKHHGLPTSQVPQGTAFGCATQYGVGRGGKAITQAGLSQRYTPRNPISWEGADVSEHPDEHNRGADLEAREVQRPQIETQSPAAATLTGHERNVSHMWAHAQAPEAASPQLREEQMQQTWAELMRNGSVKPSAAMALVDASYLPKAYSSELMGEQKPRRAPQPTTSMLSVGATSNASNFKDNKVSSRFTSQFNSDPYY